MNNDEIKNIVHECYWEYDYNCATTVMKTLANNYSIKLEKQVIDTLIGMHGAGKYGAQCGLVEGSLMFMGIYGKERKLDNDTIVDLCYKYAKEFENKFGSLECNVLRPEGFKSDNPPHLCENLTRTAIRFIIDFIDYNIINKCD